MFMCCPIKLRIGLYQAITTKIVAGQNDKEDVDGEKLILPAAKK